MLVTFITIIIGLAAGAISAWSLLGGDWFLGGIFALITYILFHSVFFPDNEEDM